MSVCPRCGLTLWYEDRWCDCGWQKKREGVENKMSCRECSFKSLVWMCVHCPLRKEEAK